MTGIVNAVVFTYCAFYVYYLFVFAAGARLAKRNRTRAAAGRERFFAVFFPVYKDDAVILSSVASFFRQQYTKHRYDVFVIADSLHDSTERQLAALGATVIPAEQGPRTKAKALNTALNRLGSAAYDACVVFDADNHTEPGFLQAVNESLEQGWRAIQCHRAAKNVDTPIAYLDALSEEIANSTLRKGHRVFGLSAGLAGSGMVFEYALFKSVMAEIVATNGFDKDLEFSLFKRGIPIEYLDDVRVYDEKVQSAAVLQHQRTRWFAAQKKNIRKGWVSLRSRFTVDGFDKWLQMIMLPRMFLLLAVTACTLAAGVFGGRAAAWGWLHLEILLIAGLFIAIPGELYRVELVHAIAALPRAIRALVLAAMRIRTADGTFLHTPHFTSSETAIEGKGVV